MVKILISARQLIDETRVTSRTKLGSHNEHAGSDFRHEEECHALIAPGARRVRAKNEVSW